MMLSYNSVKCVICHNSGLESISKFFRLVITVCILMALFWLLHWLERRDCSYRKQKDVEVYVFPLLVKYFSPPAHYKYMYIGFSL